MMYFHRLLSIFLSLSTLPKTLGFDPRAASLQSRGPEPVNKFFCCTKPSEATFVEADLAGAPKGPAEPGSLGPRPELDAEELRAYPTEPKPYPTQVERPRLTDDHHRYLVAVVAVSWDRKLLLIRDRRGTEGWRLPESDWSQDERSAHQAVSREAHDTAGIDPHWTVLNEPKLLGARETSVWREADGATRAGAEMDGARSHYYQFMTQDHEVLDAWPGQGRWERKWAAPGEFETELAGKHPEYLAVLKRSAFLYPRIQSMDPWEYNHIHGGN